MQSQGRAILDRQVATAARPSLGMGRTMQSEEKAILDGRVAIVTGASRGIGRAIALGLARAGAWVAVNYCSGEAEAREVTKEIVAAGGTAMPVQADVSSGKNARILVEKVVEQWDRVDILVNNAGITRDRRLNRMSDDEWLEVINTNLNSAFFCISAVIPTMIQRNYGRIINIASVIGESGNIGQANYAASKGGIISFTKSAALELAKHNITVNAVAPGFTRTDMLARVPEAIQAQILSKIPLGRFAEPKEIAEAVFFLAAHGDYITGHVLDINGGLHM